MDELDDQRMMPESGLLSMPVGSRLAHVLPSISSMSWRWMAIDAPTNAGKTYWIRQFIEHHPEVPFLIIVPRRVLVDRFLADYAPLGFQSVCLLCSRL